MLNETIKEVKQLNILLSSVSGKFWVQEAENLLNCLLIITGMIQLKISDSVLLSEIWLVALQEDMLRKMRSKNIFIEVFIFIREWKPSAKQNKQTKSLFLLSRFLSTPRPFSIGLEQDYWDRSETSFQAYVKAFLFEIKASPQPTCKIRFHFIGRNQRMGIIVG